MSIEVQVGDNAARRIMMPEAVFRSARWYSPTATRLVSFYVPRWLPVTPVPGPSSVASPACHRPVSLKTNMG